MLINSSPFTFWIANLQLDTFPALRSHVLPVWVPGHRDIPGNCRSAKLLRLSTVFPESTTIELGIPLTSIKLVIRQQFLGNANLCLTHEESWTIFNFIVKHFE